MRMQLNEIKTIMKQKLNSIQVRKTFIPDLKCAIEDRLIEKFDGKWNILNHVLQDEYSDRLTEKYFNLLIKYSC